MKACLEQLRILLTNLNMSADHMNVWKRERGEGDESVAAAAPSRPGISLICLRTPWR
jgi:hypothetical protein